MYKTVREGDASLQYTILPQRDQDAVVEKAAAMALRHGPCGCGLRSRLGYVLAALVLVSCGVLAALVFPALSSDVDLDAALQSLDAFGGAGRTAHVNPNVHHPPSRQAARQPAKAVKPLSEEDDDDGNTDGDDDDYPPLPPGQDVAIAMISAPEPPPAAPAVVRAAPTPTRPKPIRDQAVDDEDDEDDDEDDDSSESRELGAPRRVPDAPPPPGLPPSLLPQRQPPGPAGDGRVPGKVPLPLMLDPMMLGDAPQRAQRTQRAQHHKTNNGLYTNEDDLDHNILDLARQGRGQGRARQHASTRIFVEALLPSIEDQPGEPAAPQRRAWTPSSTFFRWTYAETSVLKKIAFAAGILVGLCVVSLGLLIFVRRRRTRSRRPPAEHHHDGGLQDGLQNGLQAGRCHHTGTTRTAVRRESKMDAVRGVDLATTRDLLDGSEEEA